MLAMCQEVLCEGGVTQDHNRAGSTALVSSGINMLWEGPMTTIESDAINFKVAMSSSVTFGITWSMSAVHGHSWACFNLLAL